MTLGPLKSQQNERKEIHMKTNRRRGSELKRKGKS